MTHAEENASHSSPAPPALGLSDGSALSVEAAAIMDPSRKVWTLPRPARHHDIIRHMVESGYGPRVGGDCEQGFVLNNGMFVRRVPAANIALDAGQISKLNWPPNLYSEDIW